MKQTIQIRLVAWILYVGFISMPLLYIGAYPGETALTKAVLTQAIISVASAAVISLFTPPCWNQSVAKGAVAAVLGLLVFLSAIVYVREMFLAYIGFPVWSIIVLLRLDALVKAKRKETAGDQDETNMTKE
jgi:hypothetical protein